MTSTDPTSGINRLIDWWFRDRRTGALVFGQFPNPALWVWLACLALQSFGDLTDDAALLVRGAGRAALAIWALDEIVRGCNPFRRVLGGVVLTVSAIGWFTT